MGLRVGLFGGSFSPPHHGHVICAQEARIQLDLDEVLIIPVGTPPHRETGENDDPGDEMRVNMCRLAVIGQPGLEVSTIEIEREGLSYTVDTLEKLKADSPDTEFTLIIGADQAMSFGNWHEPERIGELAAIAVATRADADRASALAEVQRAAGVEAHIVAMPRVDISSSLIRERIYGSDTVAHLVPAGIAELIEERELYR